MLADYLNCVQCTSTIAPPHDSLTLECGGCGTTYTRTDPLEKWELKDLRRQPATKPEADPTDPYDLVKLLDAVETWTGQIRLGLESSDVVRINDAINGLQRVVSHARKHQPQTFVVGSALLAPEPAGTSRTDRFWQRAFLASLSHGTSPKYAQTAADESLRIYNARRDRQR